MVALDECWLAQAGTSTRQLAGWLGLAGPYDFIPIRNPKVRPVFHHPDVPADSQRNAVQLAGALKQAGVATTLKVYDRTNHITLIGSMAAPLRFLAPLLDNTEAFIKAG